MDSAQITRTPVQKGSMAGAALQFLLGEGRLEESFRASFESCGDKEVKLVLVPQSTTPYDRLTLTSSLSTGLVTATSVRDLFGNETFIEFSSILTDQSPSSALFTLIAPEGVEVIDLERRK